MKESKFHLKIDFGKDPDYLLVRVFRDEIKVIIKHPIKVGDLVGMLDEVYDLLEKKMPKDGLTREIRNRLTEQFIDDYHQFTKN